MILLIQTEWWPLKHANCCLMNLDAQCTYVYVVQTQECFHVDVVIVSMQSSSIWELAYSCISWGLNVLTDYDSLKVIKWKEKCADCEMKLFVVQDSANTLAKAKVWIYLYCACVTVAPGLGHFTVFDRLCALSLHCQGCYRSKNCRNGGQL